MAPLLRKHTDNELERQRWGASQAGREQANEVLKANTLEHAADLAMAGRLAESRRVIQLNYFSEEAR